MSEGLQIDPMFLFDAHAHLAELKDLSQSLAAAKEIGVGGVMAVGSEIESNKKTLEISQSYPQYVYPAIGYHPWEVIEEEVETNLLFIRNHIMDCVALGEIGLDYRAKVKKELQHKVFGELLDIANQFDKPIIVHCRFSHRDAFQMISDKGIRQAVFHWYSGPLELLDEIFKKGYFISATPALAYSPPHREAIRKAPLERILLETDTPVSYQGMESRPKDVRITMKEVRLLKGLDPELVTQQTTLNACECFRLSFL